MAQTTASALSNDQKKFIAAALITRTYQRLICKSVCKLVTQPKGHGLTAYFNRFNRIATPVTALAEGQSDPTPKALTLSQVSATMDYWGDIVEATDIAIMTSMHDVPAQIAEVLSTSAQTVIDREVQIVWCAGTNVIFGDGTVTTRSTVTASMKMTETLLGAISTQLTHQGAPRRTAPAGTVTESAESASSNIGGSAHYLAIMPKQLIDDLMATSTSLGTWASVAMYQDKMKLYNGEYGMFKGIRIVETNFAPIYRLLGNTTAAVASGNAFGTNTPVVTAVDGGGTLTSGATYYYKVTRKDLLRGFEEDISIEHTTAAAATANNESFTFNFSSLTAGFVYNLYFGSSTGDANLKLHTANIEVGTTVTVTAVPSSTTTAPASLATASAPVALYAYYVHGADSCAWVGLKDLEFYETEDKSIIGNALRLRRQWAYKFYAKSLILDQVRMVRGEVAATNNPSNPTA